MYRVVELRIRCFYKYLLETLCECTGKTQRAFVESWIERECKWNSDLRTIPTFVAKMSQMARDACATLVLINVLQGVSMRHVARRHAGGVLV